MKLTGFVGRVIVEEALAAGHAVTLFNRGVTNAGLFEGVTEIRGDRDIDVGSLSGLEFDAVVDTSAYVPRHIESVLSVLKPPSHYTLMSSASVYADHGKIGVDESDDVEVLSDPTSEDVEASYGGLQALGEKALNEALPGRTNIVRADLIVGPYDSSGRFKGCIRLVGDLVPFVRSLQLLDPACGWQSVQPQLMELVEGGENDDFIGREGLREPR